MEPTALTVTANASPLLDSALEKVSALEFPPPAHFVSHAPMACEALAAQGCEDRLARWVRHFAGQLAPAPSPVDPPAGWASGWADALGNGRRLPVWIGFFERSIADDGWPAVVRLWVPRLMPGLASALFHGVIRTAHAVRALDAVGTPARRGELARALGSWASWYRAGATPRPLEASGDARLDAVDAAADAAGCFVAKPDIYHLHLVTGAMAVARLAGHLTADDGAAAVSQLRADHAAMLGDLDPTVVPDRDVAWDPTAVEAAAESFDAHQIKLVDSCHEGFAETGDAVFVAAARLVTGLG